ncbi:MAG: hypothetical protein QGH82_07690, partial [Candidatus Woesearchaeota archaeon]|nr:hypothetical protein [Candidatus Woesearchaeota archaeon]
MFWVAVIFIVSFCSLFYEVALAQTLSIIFGDTVTQYSITIGLYLFFLGMGSFLSERHKKSKTTLAWVEILLAFLSITGVLVLLYYQGDITRLKLVDMHISRGWYYFVSVIVYLPVAIIGLLSGMEIPLLERASKLKIANVLGVDYIGSLVAAVSFPLLLLPYLGLLKSVLLASSLNAIVAAILIWKRRTLALCVGVLIVFVFLGGLWANTDSIQQSLDMAFVTSTVHSNQS